MGALDKVVYVMQEFSLAYCNAFDGEPHKCVVAMPAKAEIKAVRLLKGYIVLWALVDLGEKQHVPDRVFTIVGTDFKMLSPPWRTYIGTVLDKNENNVTDLAWHVFEGDC